MITPYAFHVKHWRGPMMNTGEGAPSTIALLEHAELQARLDNAILMMIRAHVGKPCPTRREIMGWTAIPRRSVWRVLRDMQARSLIEVEVREQAAPPEGALGEPKRRRMRVTGEGWTDWTARRPVSAKVAA